jgi:hypothetical protein
VSADVPFIDQYKRALRDDRSLSARYPKRGEAANIKLLLLVLMLRYPNISPSGPTIMADCGWSDERTLTKAKRQAVEAGWLEILHRGTGPGDATVYGLKLPALNAGTSDAGTSAEAEELPALNAARLPAFNAEDYPHSMGDKDPMEDPKEDSNYGVVTTLKENESGEGFRPKRTVRRKGSSRLEGDGPSARGVVAAEDRPAISREQQQLDTDRQRHEVSRLLDELSALTGKPVAKIRSDMREAGNPGGFRAKVKLLTDWVQLARQVAA